MQILDSLNNIVLETDSYNFFDYKTTSSQVELASQQIIANYATFGSQEITVRVVIMAQSKEKWAGFFGPRFKSEQVLVMTYEKDRHWVNKVPVRQVAVGSAYHSYCNMGVGDHFFGEGQSLQPHYNSLRDMDVPHTHIINHPFDTEFSYDHAFYGGSSLLVRKESIKLLKLVVPQ